MKIAYVCADGGIDVFGKSGAARHIQEMIHALTGLEAEVELFAPLFNGHRPYALSAVPFRPLPFSLQTLSSGLDIDPIVRSALIRFGPFDAVYERHSLYCAAGMEYARRRRIPGLLEVNAPLVEEHRRYRGTLDVDLALRQRHRAFRAASRLLVISSTLSLWLGQVIGYHDKMIIIPNGVDHARFRPQLQTLKEDRGLTIGFCGSMKPWHDLESLIEAFRRVERVRRGIRLELVGDGPTQDKLFRRVERLGLASKVRFVSAVSPELLPSLMKAFDITVAPYRRMTPFYFSPLKIFESMALGCAIVTTRQGDLPALLEEGRAGLLYRPGSTTDLSRVLLSLIDRPFLRQAIGREALRFSSKHSWHARAKRVVDLL